MVNILGPGLSGDQATSSRPSHVLTGSGVDLWFKDCSSEIAQDGTRIRAQWLNMVMAQLREAIRGMGVADDEDDDQMLLKCFQAIEIDVTQWLNLPIYPHCYTNDGKVSVTNIGGGTLEVAGGQSFVHRGWNKVNTNDYDTADRRVTTLSNKTYHLRWQYNSGSPIFVLKDTADGVYNPGALVEQSGTFDSDFDDMLIARIVTDGSNVPTITTLSNKIALKSKQDASGTPTVYPSDQSARATFSFTTDWARTPQVIWKGTVGLSAQGYMHGHANLIAAETVNRYYSQAAISTDWLSLANYGTLYAYLRMFAVA